MFARMLTVGGCTVALVLALGADPVDGAQDKAKVKAKSTAKTKPTAKLKVKAEPLNTDVLFKKLDVNKDKLLDTEEFGKILTVEPAPKRRKDADPLDLSIAFKSLDANGDKKLDVEEFKGVVGAIYPNKR
jgi:hypothetical protein